MTGEFTSWDFTSFDSVRLKIHEMGEGRPLLLLHGLFSNAHTNWIKYGHAATLAEAGFRVVMPDLRAHGQSESPHDPGAYRGDVLIKDALALIDQLGWDDYDIGGFSLGARTTAKLLIGGLLPRRAILAGMGLEGLTGWDNRMEFFLTAIEKRDEVERGDPHWMAVQFMKTQKVDADAMLLLLRSFTDVRTDKLDTVTCPTLIVCGDEDRDNGDPVALAKLLPDAQHVAIPGTHMSCVTKPELGQAMADFLTEE